MKILFMNNGYLSRSLSGGTRHLLEIANEFSLKHDVQYLLPSFAKGFLSDAVKGITYKSSPASALVSIIATYTSRIFQASILTLRSPADVVISLSLLFDTLPAWRHKRKYGSTWVVYVFHLIPKRESASLSRNIQCMISKWAQRISLSFCKRADVIFAGNSLVKAQLEAYGISSDKIAIQFPTINIDVIRKAKPKKVYDGLFVGRLVAQKGVFDILDVVKGLPVKIGIIGEGEEKDNLQDRIKAEGLESKVEMLGAVPDDELYSLLKGCRFLLFPSYEEGYGIVIAEAIVAKIPVVTYDLPHYEEAFGKGLFSVPVGNVSALRQKIEGLLNDSAGVDDMLQKYNSVTMYNREQAASFAFEQIKKRL